MPRSQSPLLSRTVTVCLIGFALAACESDPGDSVPAPNGAQACDRIIGCAAEINWWAADRRTECEQEMSSLAAEGEGCWVSCIQTTTACQQINECTDESSARHAQYCKGGTPVGGQDTSSGDYSTLDQCLQGECAAVVAACTGECQSISACVSACADESCINQCAATYPGGVEPLSAIVSCGQTNCSEFIN